MYEICGIESGPGRFGKKNLKTGDGAVPDHI